MTHRAVQNPRVGFACWSLLMLVLAPPGVGAQELAYGTPTYFKVWVEYCEISSDGGATWTTLWNDSRPIELASVTPGSKVLDFVQEVPIPAGTYNRLRYKLSQMVIFRGEITYGDTTYYTAPNFLQPAKTAPPAEMVTGVFAPLQTVQTLTLPVPPGQRVSIQIDFGIKDKIILVPGAPGTVNIQALPPVTAIRSARR